MSHLDEGTLHALLDSELETSEMHQIQAHLGRCSACAMRLNEVKGFRSEADRLIGSLGSVGFATAPPPPPSAPADIRSAPVLLIPDPPDSVLRRERRTRLMGWAAMLLMAVGAGYLAIEVRNRDQFTDMTASETEQPSKAPLPADSAVIGPEESMDKSAPTAGGVGHDTAQPPTASIPESTPHIGTPATVTKKDAVAPKNPTVGETVAAEAAAELAKLRESHNRDKQSTKIDERTARQLRAAAATADIDRARRAAQQQAAEQRAAEQRAAQQRAAEQRAAAERVATPTSVESTPPPTPPTLDQRAQVYLRIGLDEAMRQLGSPMHVIEGMSPALVGLVQGRVAAGMDSTRPVVRAVYLDPSNRLIILDQQRLRSGQSPGVATQLRSIIGDVIVQLHGEPGVNVLRNLASRIR